jgi:hypothetical protein
MNVNLKDGPQVQLDGTVKVSINSDNLHPSCFGSVRIYLVSGCGHPSRLSAPTQEAGTTALCGENDFRVSRSSRAWKPKKRKFHVGCAMFLSFEVQNLRMK